MKQSVMIKGNPYGLTIVLDPECPFSQLRDDMAAKFQDSADFFKNAKMAVAFEGRELTAGQQMELVSVITENSNIHVLCLVDSDKEREKMFREMIEKTESADSSKSQIPDSGYSDDHSSDSTHHSQSDNTDNPGQFYKGTLRGGQVLEADGSIIILGDVNPGGKVIAKGNIIVLGALKGIAYAGISGNEHAFVAALEMAAMQIRISDTIARSSDAQPPAEPVVPKIAYLENGNIYVETICKEVLNDIKLV